MKLRDCQPASDKSTEERFAFFRAAALRTEGAKHFSRWVESGSLAELAASTRLDARARELEARKHPDA